MDDSYAAGRHSNPSGLDFVHSRSNPVEPLTGTTAREFAALVLTTRATRERYWRAETLTLWQALALYCYLDPDMLGASTSARIQYLRKVAAHLRYADNLRHFCSGLDLIAPLSGVLPLLLQRKDNWLDSTISAPALKAHLQSWGLHVSAPSVPYRLCIPKAFSSLHLALEAYLEFWDGRTTGPFRDEPRKAAVTEFIRERGGSGALCEAISRVVRPEGARRGRPQRPTSPGTLQDALGPYFWKFLEDEQRKDNPLSGVAN